MLNLSSRVFGCVAFVHSYNPQHGKLDPRAIKCGESYLEVEPVIESLPFPTQDLIEPLLVPTQDVQVQEVTKPTLVLEQVQLFEPEVSIPENPIEDVTYDMLIALRKGNKYVSSILFLNLYVLTISLYNIEVLLLPLM
ncbi:hypothetical protein CR513_07932, partial [Mucuna pruriens]